MAVPTGTCYGSSDVALDNGWKQHIAVTKAKLPEDAHATGAIYSSPLGRCMALADSFERTVCVDPRLAEFDFGDWEMRLWDAVPRDELDAWILDLATYTVPGGESLKQVNDRAGACLRSIIAPSRDDDQVNVLAPDSAIVISHGGVIRALLASALGIPLTAVFRLQVDYGSVSCMHWSPRGWHVEFVNR